MRGRKQAPPEVKRLRGDRKSRVNVMSPEMPPAGDDKAPPILDKAGAATWEKYFPILNSSGVLKKSDLDTLQNFCMASSAVNRYWREFKNSGPEKRAPNGACQAVPFTRFKQAVEMHLKLSSELGLTPASRSRIQALGENDELAKAVEFLRHGKSKVG